ncbi:MAG: DUF4302 domain-containing protein [Prevotella sp.]|jgi:hypothetical protein
MNIYKFSVIAALALPLVLSSCLKDQEDAFEESSSARMQAYLSKTQEVLTSSENGWALDYYPDRDLSYGGFAYTVQFDSTDATVGSILDTESTETSLYKMTTDDGPVLSFDSYNTLMHYFATPTSSRYEAYDGDFEFVIDSIGEDEIIVHGKRSQNTMIFRRLTKTPEQYLSDVESMTSSLYVTGGEGTIGGTDVVMTIDYDAQQLSFVSSSDTAAVSYTVIDTGLRFYEPVTVNGVTFSELAYDSDTRTFSGTGTDGTTFTLTGTLPENYVLYDDYAGTYWFKYNNTYYTKDSCKVTLTPSSDGEGYIMSGLNDNYTIYLSYIRSTGQLEMNSQVLGEYGGNYVWLCAWGLDTEGGSLTWATDAGMLLTWNGDSENPVYTFGPNNYSGLVADSFIMWATTTSGSNMGAFSGVPSWAIQGESSSTYRLYLVNCLEKIN